MPDAVPWTTRVEGAVVRAYGTEFELDEDPISESGLWVNGSTDGESWADVIVRDGVAFGAMTRMVVAERRVEQGNLLSAAGADALPEGDYDDPTALLTGQWGADQHARGRVFSKNQTDMYFQEVELRLRSSMSRRQCTGYEVFWRCLSTEEGYAEIARWNGGVGDFTSLVKLVGSEFGVKHGDVVEATVVGNVITGYVNGKTMITATDDTFATGSPGIGFNFGVGNTNVDHGFTSFDVRTYA
jgi:hypothetical protein